MSSAADTCDAIWKCTKRKNKQTGTASCTRQKYRLESESQNVLKTYITFFFLNKEYSISMWASPQTHDLYLCSLDTVIMHTAVHFHNEHTAYLIITMTSGLRCCCNSDLKKITILPLWSDFLVSNNEGLSSKHGDYSYKTPMAIICDTSLTVNNNEQVKARELFHRGILHYYISNCSTFTMKTVKLLNPELIFLPGLKALEADHSQCTGA